MGKRDRPADGGAGGGDGARTIVDRGKRRPTDPPVAKPVLPDPAPAPAGDADADADADTDAANAFADDHSPTASGVMTIAPLGMTFTPGDLVAERYRVVRPVANGGMGEVYEVDDLELRESIALKTILPELAKDARVLDRFKREVQLARRITHPNVCRLFDMSHHDVTRPDGTREEVVFLTMELLTGETLAGRLKRLGKFSTPEALPIVRQMAAGLAATHETGIIHRDFKSENVVLVERTGSSTGTRAVIADFGIARGEVGVDRFAPSVTLTGEFIGSPTYMAPEQVEGDELGPAADIYSLGIVMYEMVTGTLPFRGVTDFATAAKRLTQKPESPRVRVPELDPQWEAVILRCLERQPADRFARVEEVAAALEPKTPLRRFTANMRTVAATGWRPRNVALLAIAVAGVGVGGVLIARHSRSAAPPLLMNATPGSARHAVAVLPLVNRSANDQTTWTGVALASFVHAELAAGEQLHLLADDTVASALDELPATDGAAAAQASLRRSLGADYAISGTYAIDGDKLAVDVRLDHGGPSDAPIALHEDGTTADLPALVDRLGGRLRETIGVGRLGPVDRKALDAVMIQPRDAVRDYADGLTALRRGDPQAARDKLQLVVAAVPAHALAHAALSRAWSALGYEKQARDEAERAVGLSKDLAREDRLVIEARRAEASADWPRAAELYSALWTFFPDDLEWGLKLADADSHADKNKDYEAAVAAMRRLPAPTRDDPRIDLAEADLAENLGNFKQEIDASARAIVKVKAQGGHALFAQAVSQQGWAQMQLGDPEAAIKSYEIGAQIGRDTNNRMEVAAAMINIASVRRRQGKRDEAMQGYRDALAIYDAAGTKSKSWQALNGLAIALSENGDLPAAGDMFERARVICQEDGDRAGEGTALINSAQIMQSEGHLVDATARAEDALAIARAISDRRLTAISLFMLGGISEDAGDLGEARRRIEQSLAAREEMGDAAGVAGSRVALASILVDDGHPADAVVSARAAAEELDRQSLFDDAANAYTVLARALLVSAQLPDARAAVDKAVADAAKGDDKGTHLAVELVQARVAAASGHPDPAAAVAIEKEAGALGLPGAVLDAKLAALELAQAGGHGATARAPLIALAHDARTAGFELLARRAEAAAKK